MQRYLTCKCDINAERMVNGPMKATKNEKKKTIGGGAMRAINHRASDCSNCKNAIKSSFQWDAFVQLLGWAASMLSSQRRKPSQRTNSDEKASNTYTPMKNEFTANKLHADIQVGKWNKKILERVHFRVRWRDKYIHSAHITSWNLGLFESTTNFGKLTQLLRHSKRRFSHTRSVQP